MVKSLLYENCLQQDNFADTSAKIFLLQFEDDVPKAMFSNFTQTHPNSLCNIRSLISFLSLEAWKKKEGSSELAFAFQFLPVLSRPTGFTWYGHTWEWDNEEKTSRTKGVNSVPGRIYFKNSQSHCYWQVTIYQGLVNEWQEKNEIAGTGYTSVLIDSPHAMKTLGGWNESLIYLDQNGSKQKEK